MAHRQRKRWRDPDRARLGLPPQRTFEKFIAGVEPRAHRFKSSMIGCATSDYSIYPTDLYD